MTPREVVVEKDDGSLAGKRRQLKKLGLTMESPYRFTGVASSNRRIRNIKLFCSRNHARFYFNDIRWVRSANYRQLFFRTYPALPGDRYRCVYCGRKKRKDDITVDHIYPVAKASSSLKAQEKLRKKKIMGVNDPKNLVPACAACNAKKGTKTGIWVIRAKLGKSESLWRIRKLLRAMLTAFMVFAAYGFYAGWFSLDFAFGYEARQLLQELFRKLAAT